MKPLPAASGAAGRPRKMYVAFDRSYPLVPGVDEVCGAPRRVLARRVVVELDVHAVEEPRPERLPQHPVRERALRRRRDPHLLLPLAAVALEVPR